MKNLMTKLMLALTLAIAASMVTTSSANAKGTPQNHHCAKDGTTVPGKTHKECVKDGGKWEKDAPSAAKPADDDKKPDPAAK